MSEQKPKLTDIDAALNAIVWGFVALFVLFILWFLFP
jgi:hypothetical protein